MELLSNGVTVRKFEPPTLLLQSQRLLEFSDILGWGISEKNIPDISKVVDTKLYGDEVLLLSVSFGEAGKLSAVENTITKLISAIDLASEDGYGIFKYRPSNYQRPKFNPCYLQDIDRKPNVNIVAYDPYFGFDHHGISSVSDLRIMYPEMCWAGTAVFSALALMPDYRIMDGKETPFIRVPGLPTYYGGFTIIPKPDYAIEIKYRKKAKGVKTPGITLSTVHVDKKDSGEFCYPLLRQLGTIRYW